MNHHDLLIEIFTEELPPKRLSMLENAFASAIEKQLCEAQLVFENIKSYATPRRLAVLVHQLAEQQPAQKIERKGPNVSQAYDAEGQLTPAGKGFLNSCGITADQLSTIKTDKGECLNFVGKKPGLSVTTLIPEIVKTALKELPIPKPMRWGSNDFQFIRPVHSIILLYGENVIPTTIFGLESGRVSYGHRQMCRDSIAIGFPDTYETQLEETGCVIADAKKRKEVICDQIATLVQEKFSGTAEACLDNDLLEEVTALVEWPKVLLCQFDEAFLQVPQEALIASMQSHQKCFAIADKESKKLLPYFLTVSNLESTDKEAVIHGNERVMRARLSDAKFFYETDLKTPLEALAPRLEKIIYQEKLGTLAEKVTRVKKLARSFLDSPETERAVDLCKLDLLSHMVGEFPELQGVMGKYYALHAGEKAEVANAIEEHYWPRFAEDEIPTAPVSIALALADRLDTLVGFFSVGLVPTGDKDPFALRRAASGFLKIIFENQLSINLQELHLTENLLTFLKERFKGIVLEKEISIDIFNAIPNLTIHKLSDAFKCMQALQQFKTHPAAPSLAQANKRVKNLLTKNNPDDLNYQLDLELCEKEIEKTLISQIVNTENRLTLLLQQSNYSDALLLLAEFKPILDQFFEEVMVMTEDLKIRTNRLALLKKLRALFLRVADFSELQLTE